ncbi:MAG: UvrD-helicase domain-containing protein [Flavobacteriales bacterium]|nr:UvrD-helicase domain-containing protein [Flavobacteriales bacterium]
MSEKKSFHIYKSSAGSGKTTALIGDYLQLSLSSSNPHEFKKILAITFTNKAANELKQRFLSILSLIKDIDISIPAHLQNFEVKQLLSQVKISALELKLRAKKVLEIALRDYDEIGISTIDSFNHKLISSFSRDLNIKSDFEVELEEANFFSEAVDMLLEKVGSDAHITKHLLGYLEQSLEENKKTNISQQLIKLRPLLTSETAIKPIESIMEVEPEEFEKTKKSLFPIISNFEKSVQKIGSSVLSIFLELNVSADDLKQKSSGYFGYFKRLSEFKGEYKPLHGKLLPVVEESWYVGSAKREVKDSLDLKHGELLDLYHRSEELFEGPFSKYMSAKKLLSQIHLLAVLADLSKSLKELAKERNVVMISEFNRIISKSMHGEPVAYIYEKFGNRFKHILIDEFQDTSELQWKNITPFITDSLSEGQLNMVVGDAKQSIYRWRGGKAEQLIHLPELDHTDSSISPTDRISLRENSRIVHLDTNYRSLPTIVNFNNGLIELLKDSLTVSNTIFRKEYEGASSKQKFPDHKVGGYVKWTQLEKNARPVLISNQTIDSIQEAIADGYSFGDMAILVRKKGKEVNAIIEALTKAEIPFTTRDSFGLDMNSTVVMLLEFLRLSADANLPPSQVRVMREICRLQNLPFHPEEFWKQGKNNGDLNFTHFLKSIDKEFSLDQLRRFSAIEICYEVLNRFVPIPIRNDVFIQSFLNCILERGYSSSATEVIDWWDSLSLKPEAKSGVSENQVKIMTIHKSKGLQFPVVIIPNLNWKLNKTEIKWIPLNSGENIPFSYMPMPMTKSLIDIGYSSEYEKYLLEISFDNLNLIYVALTRPSERLYLFHCIGSKDETGQVVNQAYDRIANEEIKILDTTLQKLHHSEEGIQSSICLGGRARPLEKPSQKQTKESNLKVGSAQIIPIQERFKISHEGVSSNRDTGILFHDIASKTFSLEEAKVQLDRCRINGGVSDESYIEVLKWFEALYSDEKYLSLLETAAKLSERPLQSDGDVMRPDVVFKTKSTFKVIDFKTGRKEKSHIQQVKKYLKAITQVEDKTGEGYVVYVPSMEWTPVLNTEEENIQGTLF